MEVLIVHQWPAFWAMGENAGASSFFETAHGYVLHGHRVRVVLPTMENEPDGEYREMSLLRVPFEEDPMTLRSGPAGLIDRIRRYSHFRKQMGARARAACAEQMPDVIVALGPHSAAVAGDVARDFGIPNVTRLFGQALSLHMNERGGIASPRFFGNFAEIIAFRTPCRALIVHDDGSRGNRVAGLLGASERLHYWRDGIDTTLVDQVVDRTAARRELGYDEDDVVVVSVGRMSIEKALGKVVAATAASLPEAPSLKLLFVGDGSEQANLESLCAELSLSDRVRFAGPIPRDRLHVVYHAADMLVSTSNRTNMTNSTIEAMAFGVPVIAIDAGDTNKVVRDNDTGLLVETGDERSIARAITRLATDPELRHRLGQQARAFVRANFETVPERVAREVTLVESIVTEERG